MDLAQFGVSKETLAGLKHTEYKYPKPVPGRVAHIDADFMSYQVSAESTKELDPNDPTPRKTLDDMRHNALAAVEHIRLLAGAETAVLHVTHNSDKGGRDNDAVTKPYQANRKDRDRPKHLDAIRVHLGTGAGDETGRFTGIIHSDQEADDGMAQAAYADPENAIVCSADKDLLMVPGWKLDMYKNTVYRVKDSFGRIWVDEKEGSNGKIKKKVTGYGTKFFWLQCLMGDQADNIAGVPMVPGRVWQHFAGTAAYKDALAQWVGYSGKDPVVEKKLNDKLEKLRAKPKLCGPMLAYAILKDAKSDKECFQTVKACFVGLEKDHGHVFTHWKTGKKVTPTQAMLGDMRLLWMRRHKDRDDVLHWIKEINK